MYVLALGLTAGAFADSPCKGLSESECSSNGKCTWVSGYSQKDGDKVKAYCRAKPGYGDSEKKGKKKKDKSDEAMKGDDDKSEKKAKKSKKKKENKSDDKKEDKKEDKKDNAKKNKDKKKKKKSKKED